MPNLKELSEEQLALHVIRTIREGDYSSLQALKDAHVQPQEVLEKTIDKYDSVNKAIFNETIYITVDNGGICGHAYLGFKNEKKEIEWYGFNPLFPFVIAPGQVKNEITEGKRFSSQRDTEGHLEPKAKFKKTAVPISEEGLHKLKQLVPQKDGKNKIGIWILGLNDCGKFTDNALTYAGKMDGLDGVFTTPDLESISKVIKLKLLYQTPEGMEALSLLDDNPFEAENISSRLRSLKKKQAFSMLEERANKRLSSFTSLASGPTAPAKTATSLPAANKASSQPVSPPVSRRIENVLGHVAPPPLSVPNITITSLPIPQLAPPPFASSEELLKKSFMEATKMPGLPSAPPPAVPANISLQMTPSDLMAAIHKPRPATSAPNATATPIVPKVAPPAAVAPPPKKKEEEKQKKETNHIVIPPKTVPPSSHSKTVPIPRANPTPPRVSAPIPRPAPVVRITPRPTPPPRPTPVSRPTGGRPRSRF